MARIKVRSPAGSEYSFFSEAEFERALSGGCITAEWQVFHGRCGEWLPVTVHPVVRRSAALRRSDGLPAA